MTQPLRLRHPRAGPGVQGWPDIITRISFSRTIRSLPESVAWASSQNAEEAQPRCVPRVFRLSRSNAERSVDPRLGRAARAAR